MIWKKMLERNVRLFLMLRRKVLKILKSILKKSANKSIHLL